MKISKSLLFATILLSGPAWALTVEEVFDGLRSTMKTGESLDEVIEDLDDLSNSELKGILSRFDPVWEKESLQYQRNCQDFIKGQLSGKRRNENKSHIEGHREAFFEVYAMGEGAMKPLLKSKSMPAIEALRRLILPTVEEVLATAPAELKRQREIITHFAKFRDAVVETAVFNDEEKVASKVLNNERSLIASNSGLPREGLRAIAENDKIAEKAELPADEREGIREVNEWRLLLGLNALLIDPKLCEAGRGHSKDMNEHGFFAHESPLPGKTTPGDRAAEAGTSGSGENIHRGQESPGAANKGWFLSPGHHKNMFLPRYRRIGLGHFKGYWTQMFD